MNSSTRTKTIGQVAIALVLAATILFISDVSRPELDREDQDLSALTSLMSRNWPSISTAG